MCMLQFAKDTSGATTIDFVVLTAGIVGLGVAVATAVSPGVNRSAVQIALATGDPENLMPGLAENIVTDNSSVYDNEDRFGPQRLFDGDMNTMFHSRWDSPEGYEYVNLDLGEPQTVTSVVMYPRPHPCCRDRFDGAQVVLLDSAGTEIYRSDPVEG